MRRRNLAPVVLDNIPFNIDLGSLADKLRVKDSSSYRQDLAQLCNQAVAIGKPKAYYRPAFVDSRGDDYVIVEGVRLSSRVLAINLVEVNRVFVYVGTCGQELEAWATTFDDLLLRFWADAISELAMRTAVASMRQHVTEHYRTGHTVQMNPGSLTEWPLTEQRPIFELLGDVQSAIGVRLTDSLLMIPRKTVSGIEFPMEANFASCQLCPREKCPGRRAEYDSAAHEKYHPLVSREPVRPILYAS